MNADSGSRTSRFVARLLVMAIGAYRHSIGLVLPDACRFHPSCSAYAIEAIRNHGPVRGLWLAAKRILRCHPFHPGGHDPVPAPMK
jgi:putative membrane protein insertion efficiency factor